jgi:GTP-binding protein LepA
VCSTRNTATVDLKAGEVGFIIAGIKDIHGAPVGDTLTLSSTPDVEVLPGFKRIQPQVYAGLFPVSSDDFEDFREALQKLTLNDSSLQYTRKAPTPWASASVAASSACCTWRSSRSAWSANTTWT